MMKNSFSDEFWWQEEGQLTSADVSYQMMGLCDYKNTGVSWDFDPRPKWKKMSQPKLGQFQVPMGR